MNFASNFNLGREGYSSTSLTYLYFLKIPQTPKRDHFSCQVSLLIGHNSGSIDLFISDLNIFPLKMIPKRKADCRKAGYSREFLVGVCRPVLQILTLFQTKKMLFFRPVFRGLKSIPVIKVIIFRLRLKQKDFLEPIRILELKRQIRL